jgi:hypothetical protein
MIQSNMLNKKILYVKLKQPHTGSDESFLILNSFIRPNPKGREQSNLGDVVDYRDKL